MCWVIEKKTKTKTIFMSFTNFALTEYLMPLQITTEPREPEYRTERFKTILCRMDKGSNAHAIKQKSVIRLSCPRQTSKVWKHLVIQTSARIQSQDIKRHLECSLCYTSNIMLGESISNMSLLTL